MPPSKYKIYIFKSLLYSLSLLLLLVHGHYRLSVYSRANNSLCIPSGLLTCTSDTLLDFLSCKQYNSISNRNNTKVKYATITMKWTFHNIQGNKLTFIPPTIASFVVKPAPGCSSSKMSRISLILTKMFP